MGKQSQAIGEALRQKVATVRNATALEIGANLKRPASRGGTPVDTNHARANWVEQVGTPYEGEVDGTTPVNNSAKVLSARLEDGPVFVTNHVPYIERLNYGYSKQTPALFVERCVEEALMTMRSLHGDEALSPERWRDEMGGVAAGNLADAYNPLGDD